MIKNRFSSAITDKPWWLAGGIEPSVCIAAYQPIGASDYESSKVNLATPGLYNAVNAAAYPTWDAQNGWKFLRPSSQWLDSGIIPTASMSMIVRYSNLVYSVVIASYSGNDTTRFGIIYLTSPTARYYDDAAEVSAAGLAPSAGVAAISNKQGYLNGVPDGNRIATAWSGTSTKSIGIGFQNGNPGSYATCYLQALSIYKYMISPYQVAALTAAMNAL